MATNHRRAGRHGTFKETPKARRRGAEKYFRRDGREARYDSFIGRGNDPETERKTGKKETDR